MARFLALLALVAGCFALSPATRGFESIDVYVSGQMKVWKVPGAAVAIVRGSEVVHVGVYGNAADLAGRSTEEPITRHTLFGIGSITKSVTVSALQTLAEEKKLDWDRPVRDYAPDFRLYTDTLSGEVTVRDLVTHRTGLPRHDAIWFRTPYTRAQLFERLRYLEPSAGLRQKYQYNNLMYMAAGVVGERISGMSWEQLVESRVLRPVGMPKATTSVDKPGDYAVSQKTNIDAVGPAGSINCNIDEFARYLRLHIKLGELDGTRIIPEHRAREMQSPQMVVHEPVYEDFGETSYAMGFFVGQYAGHKVVYHTGTIGGYHALLAFLPEQKVGLVVLQNRVERSFPKVLSAHVFDILLNRPESDWSARYQELDKKRRAAAKPSIRVGGTKPQWDFTALAGTYSHPAYGSVEITTGPAMRWYGQTMPIEHYHYDVFETKPPDGSGLPRTRVQFRGGLDGQVEELRIPLEAALPPIVFRK